MEYGVDVSRYQPDPVDWNAVRGNNITFVYAKATEATGHVDATFGHKVGGARESGIVAGGYHFARPNNPADEANHFIATANSVGALAPGSLWPVLDVEDTGIDDAYISAWIGAFRQATGTQGVLVYANLDFFTNRLNPSSWADENVALIIARYNGDPGNPGWQHPNLAIHQHSNEGTVPGIQGKVDRNVIFGAGYNLARLTVPQAG